MMKPYSHFNVTEWLAYLENRHLQEIQLGLSRIKQVAEHLDLLNPNAKIITVTGTNGKGSTVASLEAIYLAAGYQVASYSSPHLLAFNERIKVNRQPISAQQLCEAFCVVEEVSNTINTHLTYFEVTTLAALWHFKRYCLDLIILEVGLGGRLDATNIIDTDLAIITTIDFDHQTFLGTTKEAIGFEKAGILRANKPLIFADNNPPASVLKQAYALNTPLYLYGRDYNYLHHADGLQFVRSEQVIDLPQPQLHGNAIAAAIMASICLQTWLPIQRSQLIQGIQSASLMGRGQLVKGRVETLFDVAHNPQAVSNLVKVIKKLSVDRTVHAVFSALKDKDIVGLIAPLVKSVDYWYPALLTGKRAASKEHLTQAFTNCGIIPSCYRDPLSAYQVACNQAGADDLIVVYGSFITVGNVLSAVYSPKTEEIE
nr:bifunctional tetrahydrofolate synthase/dihydrofolate synthase [Legionella donaldsonii]